MAEPDVWVSKIESCSTPLIMAEQC